MNKLLINLVFSFPIPKHSSVVLLCNVSVVCFSPFVSQVTETASAVPAAWAAVEVPAAARALRVTTNRTGLKTLAR